jgi:hypothetical protein
MIDRSFARFQSFSDEAREMAAKKLAGQDYNSIFAELQRASEAANDNESEVGDQVVAILLGREFMDMLQLWLTCNKDMLLTKLSYEGRIDHGTKSW